MQETLTHTKVKGRTTFRIASVLFLLSAVFELFGVSSAALLLGAFRSGVAAALYHLFYALMYFALGIGLWRATGLIGWFFRPP